jgi:hypothetical protein
MEPDFWFLAEPSVQYLIAWCNLSSGSRVISLRYVLVVQNSRHLLEWFTFAFSDVTVASVLVTAGTELVRYPLPRKLLREPPPTGG